MHGMQVRTTAQSTAMHEAHPAHDGADMPTLMPALVHCMQFCADDIMHTHGHPRDTALPAVRWAPLCAVCVREELRDAVQH